MFETPKVRRQVQERMVSTLEQMQVTNGTEPGGWRVSVLYWLATPVALFYANFRNSEIRSKFVITSSSVISLQIGAIPDQLRVLLYMVILMIFRMTCNIWERETS